VPSKQADFAFGLRLLAISSHLTGLGNSRCNFPLSEHNRILKLGPLPSGGSFRFVLLRIPSHRRLERQFITRKQSRTARRDLSIKEDHDTSAVSRAACAAAADVSSGGYSPFPASKEDKLSLAASNRINISRR
jgi:hypothetical protein